MPTSPDPRKGDPATRLLRPTLVEYFSEITAVTGLSADDASMKELGEAVRENEELLALIDGSNRLPTEDPCDFLRLLRAWRNPA